MLVVHTNYIMTAVGMCKLSQNNCARCKTYKKKHGGSKFNICQMTSATQLYDSDDIFSIVMVGCIQWPSMTLLTSEYNAGPNSYQANIFCEWLPDGGFVVDRISNLPPWTLYKKAPNNC